MDEAFGCFLCRWGMGVLCLEIFSFQSATRRSPPTRVPEGSPARAVIVNLPVATKVQGSMFYTPVIAPMATLTASTTNTVCPPTHRFFLPRFPLITSEKFVPQSNRYPKPNSHSRWCNFSHPGLPGSESLTEVNFFFVLAEPSFLEVSLSLLDSSSSFKTKPQCIFFCRSKPALELELTYIFFQKFLNVCG